MADVMANLFFGFYFDPDQPFPWEGVDFEQWLLRYATPYGIEIGTHGDLAGSPANYHYAYVKASSRTAWVRPALVRTSDQITIEVWIQALQKFANALGLILIQGKDTEQPYMLDWYFAANTD